MMLPIFGSICTVCNPIKTSGSGVRPGISPYIIDQPTFVDRIERDDMQGGSAGQINRRRLFSMIGAAAGATVMYNGMATLGRQPRSFAM
jgi:hypothetical protein